MKAQEVLPVLLDPGQIEQLPARRLRGRESTPSKLLWPAGGSVAGGM